MSKRYLVVGHEAREHAYAWKLAQSPQVEAVYVRGGNLAMAFTEKLHMIPKHPFEELAQFVIDNQIDCTVVGDSSFMESGVVDIFREKGLPILGATKAAAELEGSKLFGKRFMKRHGIRTPRHIISTSLQQGAKLLEKTRYPIVLKADVRISSDRSAIVVTNQQQAKRAYLEILAAQMEYEKKPRVIVEDFVAGREVSYTILMDGNDWVPLAAVRDYKRFGDRDEGPNTGGMGSYSPVPWLTADIEKKIQDEIVIPTVRGMRAENLQYRGFLYIGIMVDDKGDPWVLEYNTRMGDTEGETILMLLEDDFSDVVDKAGKDSVKDLHLKWRDGCAISVAVAPPGYPTKIIEAPVELPFPETDGVMCFGSIFRMNVSGLTSGQGRLVCVTGFASEAAECRDKVYEAVGKINKDKLYCSRSDIALELVAPSAPSAIPAVSSAAMVPADAELSCATT